MKILKEAVRYSAIWGRYYANGWCQTAAGRVLFSQGFVGIFHYWLYFFMRSLSRVCKLGEIRYTNVIREETAYKPEESLRDYTPSHPCLYSPALWAFPDLCKSRQVYRDQDAHLGTARVFQVCLVIGQSVACLVTDGHAHNHCAASAVRTPENSVSHTWNKRLRLLSSLVQICKLHHCLNIALWNM